MDKYKKIVIIFLSCVILLFLTRFAVIIPSKRIKVLERILPQKEKRLKEVMRLRGEYADLQSGLQAIESKLGTKEENFNCKAWLEKNAVRTGINIKEINCGEKVCYIKIVGVKLDKVLKYLYELENQTAPIMINKMHIIENKGLLDVSIEIGLIIKEI